QLQRMHALGRSAVAPGDPAAFEAAVDDMRQAIGTGQHIRGLRLQRRRATRAVGGPEIEVGQAAREKARHFAPDRVTVEEDGVPVAPADPLYFRCERIVVGPEISRNPMYGLLLRGRATFLVDRLVCKQRETRTS